MTCLHDDQIIHHILHQDHRCGEAADVIYVPYLQQTTNVRQSPTSLHTCGTGSRSPRLHGSLLSSPAKGGTEVTSRQRLHRREKSFYIKNYCLHVRSRKDFFGAKMKLKWVKHIIIPPPPRRKREGECVCCQMGLSCASSLLPRKTRPTLETACWWCCWWWWCSLVACMYPTRRFV